MEVEKQYCRNIIMIAIEEYVMVEEHKALKDVLRAEGTVILLGRMMVMLVSVVSGGNLGPVVTLVAA
ncbi:hypothetical protein J6590_067320 [Homalodisca vitripennis]|nr:hypothetical protein J6590_067320 [Homalodisca vitripennis]